MYGGMRALLEPSSIPEGILFLENDTKEAFAVFVGYRKGEEWVHSVVDIEAGAFQSLLSVVRSEVERNLYAQLPFLDRASKTLRGGKEVFVSIGRGLEGGKRVFFLDVRICDV